MNHSLSKQVALWACNLVAGVGLPLCLLLLCSGQAVAQGYKTANTNSVNPARYTEIATRVGVAAYPLSQWDDAASATKIQQQIAVMQPSIIDGTATIDVVFRYNYYNRIHQDITQYDMALEVSMLKELDVTMSFSKGLVPKTQLPLAYNQLVNIL